MTTAQPPVIVVYTMGKVASTSVSKALREKKIPCFDVHSLTHKRYMSLLNVHIKNPDKIVIPKHLIESLHVMNAIAEGRKVRMISLIREPVGRNIAAVFQNLPERLRSNHDAILSRLQGYRVDTPDSWFIDDFIPILGLDVYRMDHDTNADHFKFSNNNIEVLLLKSHIDNQRKSDLVGEFINKKVDILNENEAKSKWYADLYSKFKADDRVISQEFLKNCMSLRYFNLFFSYKERSDVAERYGYKGWVKP